MSPTKVDWNTFRYVLALARHRSLEPAAADLQVDASTVSRRVRSLEEALGAKVFDRAVSGHSLTAVGRRILETAERIEANVAAMERVAACADHRLAGTIRILSGDSILRRLTPLLARFRRAHPQVDFQLIASGPSTRFIRRDADVAIRFVRPTQVSLASRRLTSIGQGLYASRDYLARRPFDPAAGLAGHDLVGFSDRPARTPETRWLEERAGGARFVFRGSAIDSVLVACLSGMGLAVLPCYFARGEPQLVPLLGPEEVVAREMWLILHRDSRRVNRIRAFADFLAGEFRDSAAIFEGQASTAGEDADAAAGRTPPRQLFVVRFPSA